MLSPRRAAQPPSRGTLQVLNHSYGGELHSGGERLSVVNAVFLSEATSHKSCLVSGDGAVRVALDLEHPLAVDNLAAS